MDFDAVVVGAGVNGLVAAAELAGAGWSVCLLDRAERLGGLIASDELTLPGFLHDTFSSWHPLFVTGGAHALLGPDLARHGLEYANTDDAVTASVARDGRCTVAYRDPVRTAEGFAVEADREAYAQLLARLSADLDVVGAALGSELRSLAALRLPATLYRRGRRPRLEQWVRDGAASGRRFLRRHFTGTEVDHLWVPWLLHAGLSPDSAGGGLMVPLFAATTHGAGLPVVRGGQGRFVAAFEALLRERGVTIRTGVDVDRVVVRDGRAVGVAAAGELFGARRAVLASVTPQALYGSLLPAEAVPAEARRDAEQYQFGRGAMQIHVALSRPLVWRDAALAGVPLVHLSDGSNSAAIACAQAEAGLLPARPTVVVGQQHLLDPGRVPAGAGLLWIQLQEVPFRPSGDAGGILATGNGWDERLTDGYVTRVLDLIEQHAPGTTAAVRSWSALTPADLARMNVNCVQGDPYCGATELDQSLLWRPGPAIARHRTPVPGLWHIGAATHPGPGLGGGSGHLAAQALIGGRWAAARWSLPVRRLRERGREPHVRA